MKQLQRFTLALSAVALITACDPQEDGTRDADQGEALDEEVDALFDDVAPMNTLTVGMKTDGLSSSQLKALLIGFAKNKVIEISEANTERRDNLAEVRQQLLPYIAFLAIDFAINRPDDEVELTQRTWRGIWDDSADLDPVPGIIQDRQNIYQVVEEGYYYNVTNNLVVTPGGQVPTQSFLKGNYELVNLPNEDNEGAFGLNVIDLEFGENVSRPGFLPLDTPLRDLVLEIDEWVTTGEGVGIPPFEIPGPTGVTGNLFNLYVDDELRIALGVGDPDGGASEEPAFFILRSAEFAGPPSI